MVNVHNAMIAAKVRFFTPKYEKATHYIQVIGSFFFAIYGAFLLEQDHFLHGFITEISRQPVGASPVAVRNNLFIRSLPGYIMRAHWLIFRMLESYLDDYFLVRSVFDSITK